MKVRDLYVLAQGIFQFTMPFPLLAALPGILTISLDMPADAIEEINEV